MKNINQILNESIRQSLHNILCENTQDNDVPNVISTVMDKRIKYENLRLDYLNEYKNFVLDVYQIAYSALSNTMSQLGYQLTNVKCDDYDGDDGEFNIEFETNIPYYDFDGSDDYTIYGAINKTTESIKNSIKRLYSPFWNTYSLHEYESHDTSNLLIRIQIYLGDVEDYI